MWPFQRKAQASAASGPQPVPAPVIRREWRSLAPIQRLVGPHPLTAPSDRFSDGLATHRDPSLSSDGMGHQVSADAPSGMVLSLARPTTRSDGPAMITRPAVQRRTQPTTTDSGEWEVDEAAPDAARPAPLTDQRPPGALLRELPVASVVAPAVQRLTEAPEGAPVPVARTKATPSFEPVAASFETAVSMPTPSASAASTPRLTLGQLRRLGIGAPISRVPQHSLQRSTESAESLPQSVSSERASESMAKGPDAADAKVAATSPVVDRAIQRSASVDSHTLAPIIHRSTPATSIPPRSQLDTEPSPAAAPAKMDMPLAARPVAEPRVNPTTSDPSDGPTDHAEPATTVAQSMASTPFDAATVQRAADSPPATGTASEASSDLALPLAAATRNPTLAGTQTESLGPLLSRATNGDTPSPVTVAPLVSLHPLRPSASVQRVPMDSAGTVAEPSPSADGSVSPDTDLSLPPAIDGQYAEAGTLTPAASSELALASTLRPVDAGPGPGLALTALGSPDRSVPSRGEPPRRAALAAQCSWTGTVASAVQRSATQAATAPGPLPLAPGWAASAAAHPATSDSTAATEMPLAPSIPAPVQRAIAEMAAQRVEATTSQVVTTAQREVEVPAAVASPSAAEVSSPPAPASSPEQSEHQMDELAGRLYDRIRSRLKTELLVDRERAGFLTDLR